MPQFLEPVFNNQLYNLIKDRGCMEFLYINIDGLIYKVH